ncbi:MAG: hypothetical protein COX07_03665 [Bacteroidetes bacterium CG23_combo_of_CG06-09_8_20_14_all_32_9]|nr:MAG: hypothetical protein COX07_03665 [Bacteroidetes bacterium CG23_combo_of_CG06-09_8_20_14_all_32_9]
MPNRISFSKVMIYFGLFMVFIYVVVGAMFIFAQVFTYIPREFRVIFGIFFVIYGIFRFVKIYPKLKKNSQDEDTDSI